MYGCIKWESFIRTVLFRDTSMAIVEREEEATEYAGVCRNTTSLCKILQPQSQFPHYREFCVPSKGWQ